MHLLSSAPLPEALFKDTDAIQCRVYGRTSRHWSFVPLDAHRGGPNWFELQFDLPEQLASLVQKTDGDRVRTANLKLQFFSFICLSGVIGGVRRQVKLELNEPWIDAYIQKFSKNSLSQS